MTENFSQACDGVRGAPFFLLSNPQPLDNWKQNRICFIINQQLTLQQFGNIFLNQRHAYDPPEISVENPIVHSAEGMEAQLVCIVHGENQPETDKRKEPQLNWIVCINKFSKSICSFLTGKLTRLHDSKLRSSVFDRKAWKSREHTIRAY
ncbi:hypothetical protein HUJ05_006076 [Dendroctonus ponderosae]|nr:hypothetical protein HUJ05_006076 [Dendroctonus ponderosae]